VTFSIDAIDIIALVWFLLVAVGYQLVSARPTLFARSISGAVQRHRLEWMRGLIDRDNRSADAILLGTLSQGNAFFASTSAIAIGGLAAIMGSGDKADAFLARIPWIAKSSPLLWELKVLLLISIFVYAFFKFAWAFRLTHYTAIMIGAMPNPGAAPADATERQARATALISGLAAEHSNSGLRAFYHAAAALTWFFSPIAFMAASTWVAATLIRRDYYSRSRRVLAAGHDVADPV
jgi:uncharacterized membrane protein